MVYRPFFPTLPQLSVIVFYDYCRITELTLKYSIVQVKCYALTRIYPSIPFTASFMFSPFEASAQLAGNAAASLNEQVESILSSTSTGTISPSEEKLRDSKADADIGEDGNSRGDGSKSTLPKIDSMDLDKEATLVQHFRVIESSSPNLEIGGLYPVADGQHLLVVCRDNEESRVGVPAPDSDIVGGILLLFKINFKNSVLCLDETYLAKRVLKPLTSAPKELVMLPTFLKQDESYLPYGHIPMAVMLTAIGELHLLNLTNLETVSVFRNEYSKFVSVVYCDCKCF